MGVFDYFSRASGTGRNVSGKRIVKSAMTSMLWICSIASTTCFSTAYAFKDKDGICIFFSVVGAFPFFVACFMFIYFGVKDPDRLHSEEYRLRDRMLKLTETKGGRIAVNPIELIDIANPFPDTKALEHKQTAIESTQKRNLRRTAMARPPWTYLFVYSEEVGPLEQVRDFIDAQPQITNWHFYWPGMFLLVSSLTADGLSKLVLEKLTKKKGRFLILDTDTDSAGWIPRLGWDLMKEPASALEEKKKRESGA